MILDVFNVDWVNVKFDDYDQSWTAHFTIGNHKHEVTTVTLEQLIEHIVRVVVLSDDEN